MRLVDLISIRAVERRRFQRRMLSWFAGRKRDLPWRRDKDPYRIWVSEIMLQQTRVAAVIPYYERFLAKFPDMGALARARTDRVLASWAGLGYYSRVKNMQRASKQIIARHRGLFPRDYEAALALPGIGRYTAAAVLSIAYDAPYAVLDGNVARVLARIGALRGDVRAPRVWRRLEATAQGLLAENSPADWNQAMMELGATVCTPKSPLCAECPAARWCRARKLGIQEDLPSARKKRAKIDLTLAAAVFLDPRGRTLLLRQTTGDGALFSRMWQFPALETTGTDAVATLSGHLHKRFGVAVNRNLARLATARHTVTFRNIRLEPFLVRVAKLPSVKGVRVAVLGEFRDLPISNATRKIAAVAIAHAGKVHRQALEA